MTTWNGFLASGVLVAAAVLAPGEAAAATSNCESRIGECEVSNDFDDAFSCDCANGSSGIGGGGNEWSGLSQAELDAVCLETLDVMCGEAMPPDGIPCETREGSCTVDNEPDAVSCDCADGSGGFGGGGNDWDGLSDDELFDVCLEQVELYCGPFVPPRWDCENDFGSCDLDVEDPSYVCGCANGGGGGGPGEAEWADLDADELELVCFETISEVCGGPPPTTTGETESDTSATDDAVSSEDATDDAPTSAEATDDASDESGDDTTTGDPDPTDASASASASATMTAGDTDDDESGDDAGAAGSDDAGGCSCNATGRDRHGLVGLALLGLLGLRRRRSGS